MKNKAGLALSFILIAPGVYAITYWFTLDAALQHPKILVYRSVLGFPGLSFTKQISGLLLLGMAGFYISARSKDYDSGFLRSVRIVLLIVGFVTCSMLGFSLM
jgi:membrane-bound ClpP family serine protease